MDVAVNFANTLLSGQVSPADGEFSYIARATREILRAVARTEMKDPSPHRPRLLLLHDAAQRIIESRYSDPRFTVTALAAELHVSERYLRYACSEFETSPAAMLRARRVESAREALAQLGSSPNDATGFARSHGFPSARALRIALARDSLGMREAE